MHENFDCTQFITFNSQKEYKEIIEKINSIFSDLSFKIVESSNIKVVKRNYYKDFWDKYCFELEDSEFLGDFYDWKDKSNPPLSIKLFCEAIFKLMNSIEMTSIKVIICSFADITKTQNSFVKVDKDMLLDEMFSMSINSFICPENLIIELEF
ncbi:MAG: hypothetical protein GX962_15315 [Epulopiscium sp.]|nr:hypothetical protein [Candidatus Epulonipiscium sp.]